MTKRHRLNVLYDLLYIGNFLPLTGGATIFCAQLMLELARRGCRSRVLASVTSEAEAAACAFDTSHPELEIRRFRVPYYFINPHEPAPRDWENASRAGVQIGLERMIEEARPDILLVREGWVPYANEVAERHSIPTVALVRGNPTNAIVNGTFPSDLADAFLAELRKVDRIVTVARHFLTGLRRLGFENACCIPNAIDLRSFAPRQRDDVLARQLDIQESDIVALHASQLKRLKRPLDIVRSAPEVLRRNPDVLYLIVGEGVCREEMETLAKRFGIFERFRFERFVDYGRMPQYVNLADMVIMPSESEGLSRMYLESQACGKTLIASDIPAAREVVTHKKTGLLFRKGDIDDLAEKTLLAAENLRLRAEIGKRALECVQQYGLEKVVEEYLAMIHNLLRRS
jgi:glycosyltransferase involved in cell wall biosynthesis